jgi:hypothetical protein
MKSSTSISAWRSSTPINWQQKKTREKDELDTDIVDLQLKSGGRGSSDLEGLLRQEAHHFRHGPLATASWSSPTTRFKDCSKTKQASGVQVMIQ